MKANELSNKDLQIGDWVLNVKGVPLQIKGLSNVDGWISGNVYAKVHDNGAWCDSQCFRPIQLTRDILEKNGFRDSYADTCLNKDGVYNFSDWYGHSVIIDMNENELTVKYDNKVLVCLSYRNVIKVHQLQQVLRLCDIKKEITL